MSEDHPFHEIIKKIFRKLGYQEGNIKTISGVYLILHISERKMFHSSALSMPACLYRQLFIHADLS